MPPAYDRGFDAHTHLDDIAFDNDRNDVVGRALAAGVTGLAIAGACPEHWGRVRSVGRQHGAAVAIGCHPWFADRPAEEVGRCLRAEAPAVVGEIGLDAHRGPPLAQQRAVLRAQLDVALDLGAPVVFHCVRAADELLKLLSAVRLPAGGLLHGFEGTAAHVARAVAMGLCISVGPSAVRGRGRRRDAMIRAIPADRLLLETDCPDRPVPDAERGEPSHLVRVAEAVAEVRGELPADVFNRAGDNARALFAPALGPAIGGRTEPVLGSPKAR